MIKKLLSRHLALLGGVAIMSLGILPFVAHADSSSDQSGAQGLVLQEVTVTAQRRSEDINTVPISITALSQRQMDDLQIVSVNDLISIVPGLVINAPSQYQDNSTIAIRGIYQALGTAPTTQLYIDETPIGIWQLEESYSKSPYPNIFDLDRVEVLRGPQGTLFGASAMGGAIRFITPQPSTTDSSGAIKADIGHTSEGGEPNYEVGAAYGAPIVTGLAGFRISAWYQWLGGFIDRADPYTGQIIEKNANTSSSYVIRPAFTLTPSDRWSITPALFLQHQHNNSPNSYWVTGLPPIDGSSNHVWGGTDQPLTDDLTVASLDVKYHNGNIVLSSYTSYLDRASDTYEDTTRLFTASFTGKPLLPDLQSFLQYEQNHSHTTAWQQEFRVASQEDPSSRVNWVTGVFYRNAVQDLDQIQAPSLTPLTLYQFGLTSEQLFGYPDCIWNGEAVAECGTATSRTISAAVFGDLTIDVLSGLKLDAGVRFEHTVVKDQETTNVGGIYGGPFDMKLPDAVANPVTPRVTLTYQFSNEGMVYASAAKGYRPGAANIVAPINGNALCTPSLEALGLKSAPATFEPDSLWNYEVGSKDQFFDRRLSVQASVYYIKWSNIQTSLALPSCSLNFITNTGNAVSEGFDLQLAAAVTSNMRVGAAVGYTNAYYPNALYGAPPTNPDGTPSGPPPLVNGAGQKLSGVIPWTAAVNAEYSFDIGSLWAGASSYVRVDYRWTDTMTPRFIPSQANYDPDQDPYPDPAYGVLNMRLGITHGGFNLSAYVLNATNADPRLGYNHDIPGSPVFYATAIRPVTFGLTGWYRF